MIIIARRGLFLILIVALMTITSPLSANGEHDLTLKEAIEKIVKELNLKDKEAINPDKVPDELLEELGEAIMNEMHPDEREHLFMDNMMGGEGSDSLNAMHRAMGYRYLKGYRYNYRTMWGDFGEGCGFSFPFRGHMFGWPGGIFMFIFFILIGGVVVYLLYLAITKGKVVSTAGEDRESAIELLKKRYASGEIGKEEYDKIKKDII